MADIYEYAYYLNGRYFGFLRKSIVNTGDPYSHTLEGYLTPTTADTDAIMVEYTYAPTSVSAESSVLDVNSVLALTIVDYVKYRFYEQGGDKKRADEFYAKFRKRVGKNYRNKLGTVPIIIPRGAGVLK